jgi:hypothetical protein
LNVIPRKTLLKEQNKTLVKQINPKKEQETKKNGEEEESLGW